MAALGDEVQLVLNDGRSRLGQPSTVVKVGRKDFEILRPGVVSEQTLRRLSSLMILFVCTGNTCRSPMAEVHLPQDDRRPPGLPARRDWRSRRDGDVGRHFGDDGRPAQSRGGRRDGKRGAATGRPRIAAADRPNWCATPT